MNIDHLRRFRSKIRAYYRQHKRSMPWRRTRDPYKILVSEVMLQQTQVVRVKKFYEKFMKRFPNIQALGNSSVQDVLAAWQGLGYNRRALALHRCARIITEKYDGRIPREKIELMELPGIGSYTASALRAFAWNIPDVFIETNIRRVYIQCFFPGRSGVTDAVLRRYIERTLDVKNPRDWYYALMDYGAMLGGKGNPNRFSAHYLKPSKFSGSDRELRGKILRELLSRGAYSASELFDRIGSKDHARMRKLVDALSQEGFIVKKRNAISISRL